MYALHEIKCSGLHDLNKNCFGGSKDFIKKRNYFLRKGEKPKIQLIGKDCKLGKTHEVQTNMSFK
jgi:hypothetical protein